METITCAACGREQINTNRYCEMCGKECAPAQPVATPPKVAAPSGPQVEKAQPVNSTFMGVEFAAQDALNNARSLSAVNRIIFLLAMSGAILLILAAFVPVCPPLEPSCWSSDKKLFNFGTLFPMGLGSLLSVLLLNGITQTIATRAALAAEVAKASVK